MEKNQAATKEPLGSFESSGKEPFSARLSVLLKGRSINQAARDWGVNLSTLKNYFSRQSSTPRHEVLSKISASENVPIEWLLYGGSIESSEHVMQGAKLTNGLSESVQKIAAMLELLNQTEKDALVRTLMLKGVESVLYLLDEGNLRLLQLPQVVKDQILAVHSDDAAHVAADDKKVCASTEEKDTTESRLVAKHKQAS
ncbi:hypothetical protein WAT02_002266 [Serratia marcescens]